MKIAKANEIASKTTQYRSQMPQQEMNITAKQKKFDEFAAAQVKYSDIEYTTQTAEQVADALRKQYPWVSFTFTQLGDRPEDIAQFVASAGKGVHLVIDPDVLEWMAQGQEAWTQGLEMIGKTLHDLALQEGEGVHSKGAVIAEDGEITLWSAKWENPKTEQEGDFENMMDALEQIDEARKKNAEMQKKLKMKEKKKLNYQIGKDMTRLAKGNTDKDMRALISSLYANRQKIAVSGKYNKREVQNALAQIDHVIGRARAKIRQLKEEEDIQQRAKKAEKMREEKRKMQLEQELKARRKARMARERAAIYEKMPDLPGLRTEEERREAKAEAMLSEIVSTGAAECIPAAPSAGTDAAVTVVTQGGASVEVSITPMA